MQNVTGAAGYIHFDIISSNLFTLFYIKLKGGMTIYIVPTGGILEVTCKAKVLLRIPSTGDIPVA